MEKEPGKFCLSPVSQIYFKLVYNLIKVILNLAECRTQSDVQKH